MGPDGRGQQVAVGVVDAVAAQRLAGLDELGPGRHDHHARAWRGRHPAETQCREQPDLAGPDHLAAAHQDVALLDLLAGEPDVLARLRRLADEHLAAFSSVHSTGTTAVQPSGIGRAGHDAYGGPGRQREDGGLPGSDLADHRKVDRAFLAGIGHVAERHGVPVHAGVVEDRQRDRRAHVLGHRQTDRIHQGMLERLHRLDAVEDPLEVVLDGHGAPFGSGCGADGHTPDPIPNWCPPRGPHPPRHGRGRRRGALTPSR